MQLWNTATGLVERVLPALEGRIWALDATSDGESLVSATADGCVMVSRRKFF
jgi:WD40 repeat protein